MNRKPEVNTLNLILADTDQRRLEAWHTSTGCALREEIGSRKYPLIERIGLTESEFSAVAKMMGYVKL